EWQPTDGDVAQAQQKLKALQAQVENYPPAISDFADITLLAKNLLSEIQTEQEQLSFGERFQEVKRQVQTIWDYPLIKLEDSPLTVKKVILALIILVVGFAFTRFITRQLHRIMSSRQTVDANAAATMSRLAHYALLAFVVLFAMYTVNIPLTVFTLFGGALAIGVGFGAQNLINNFISGLILMFERPIRIGDIIEVDGKAGKVEEIGARCSRLTLFSGVDVLVPNSKLLEQNVVNWTLSDQKRRYSVRVGVAYGSPTREVSKLILKAVDDHGKILKNPEPVVAFQDFGDNSLVFEVFFWLALQSTDSRVVCSDVRHLIDRLFRDAGIDIAFPQRDIHLDFARPLDVRVLPKEPPAETDSKESGE
ncbi:MAG: mechanosensitive ion channel domain-containing protein, partial [Candidatus Hydrogenedentales bacterium]